MAFQLQDGTTMTPAAPPRQAPPQNPQVQSTQVFNPPKAAPQPPTGPYPSKTAGAVLGPAMTLVNAFAARKAQTEAKRTQVAVAQIEGQNATWDAVSKAWQQYQVEHPGTDMSENSTDPQVKMLRAAVTSAWNDRVNAYAQYTLPDVAAAQADAQADPKAAQKLQQQHKKSVVSAVQAWAKGEFSPEMPQLILQSQLNQMRGVKDPTTLIPAPAPKDVLQYSKDADELKTQRAKDELSDLYAAAPGGDVSKLSQPNQDRVKQLQGQISILSTGKPPAAPTEAEQKAGVVQRWLAGDKTLTPQEIEFGSGVKPEANKTVTVDDRSGQWSVTIGPDGKSIVGKVQIGLPKDTPAQQEAAKVQADFDMAKEQYKASHPGASDTETSGAAYKALYGKNAEDAPQAAQDVAVSDAITQSIGALPEDVWKNFAYIGGDGLYHLRSASAPFDQASGTGIGPLPGSKAGDDGPENSSGNPAYKSGETVYVGGVPPALMPKYESQFQNAMRTRLKAAGLDPIAIIKGTLYPGGGKAPAQPPPSTTKAAPKTAPPGASSDPLGILGGG